MNQILYLKPEALFALLFYQTMLQQQLIEAQQKIIELQKRLDDLTPKNVPDEDVFWHIASGGVMSEEAATSEDLALVLKFKKWNETFAEKHIKPYVNPLVYGECLNQMTRGLNARITELETKGRKPKESKTEKRILSLEKRAKENAVKEGQLALIL